MSVLSITRMIVSSLMKGPDTRRYPSVPAKKTEQTRGHLTIEIEKCIFCGLCSMHCPADALLVSKAERTWHLDLFRCITCGACVEYCPKSCLHLRPEYTGPQTGPKSETFSGPQPVSEPVPMEPESQSLG